MTRNYDVVVVGAGPAGSTAARIAAERGLSVLLMDKAGFPRDKPCAGGVTAKALREIGLELPASVVEREIMGIKVVSSTGRWISARDSKRLGVTVRRSILDMFLVTRAVEAGADFLDNAPLLKLETEPDALGERYLVTTDRGRFRARAVIGADGAYGKTARLAGIRDRWSKWELGTSLSAEIDLTSESAHDGVPESDLIELYLVPPLRAAFGWAFHRRAGLHVGVGTTAFDASRLLGSFRAHFRRVADFQRLDIPCPRARGYILPTGGFRRAVAKGAVLLAGDAGGFVDPFSGEGIYGAIRSGKMAAETVADAARSGYFSGVARAYTARVRSEFSRDFRLSMTLAALLGAKDGLPFALVEANPDLVFLLADILYRPGSYAHLFATSLLRSPRVLAKLFLARLGLVPTGSVRISR
ncbi:MAG: geranylgeranyl reductase family protein [Firmicutes bacterium]|jgi:geranylgeranyl reductase family protein|nr:geranylgeranyl reductase family protein [Bacillota bacterium]MDH7496698.1 geranylgeranyl reductase family protein [Bacillota bacterium]